MMPCSPAPLLRQPRQAQRAATAAFRASSGAACSTSGRPALVFAAAAADADRHDPARRRRPPLLRAPTPMLSPPRHRRPTTTPSTRPRATFFDQAWGTQIDGQSLASQLFSLSLLPYLGFLYHLRKPETKAPPLVLFGFCFLLVFVFATIPAGIYGEGGGRDALGFLDLLSLPKQDQDTPSEAGKLTPPAPPPAPPQKSALPPPLLKKQPTQNNHPEPTAKKVYGTSLANVDWLHGGAESLLTVTNLLLVIGLRRAVRDAEADKRKEEQAAAASSAAVAEDPAGSSSSSR